MGAAVIRRTVVERLSKFTDAPPTLLERDGVIIGVQLSYSGFHRLLEAAERCAGSDEVAV